MTTIQVPAKPSPEDIKRAIRQAETGDWIDPLEEIISSDCVLTDSRGRRICDGRAHSAVEAMALAWLGAWAPDALINATWSPTPCRSKSQTRALSSSSPRLGKPT